MTGGGTAGYTAPGDSVPGTAHGTGDGHDAGGVAGGG